MFNLAFPLVLPFWLLMIFAPRWSFTRKVVETPWFVVPPLVIWTVLGIPLLGPMFDLVWSPTLEKWTAFISSPVGAAMLWAQIIAWDTFVGRWIYLESQRLRFHPVFTAPMLFLTALLPPLVLPAFLVIRKVCDTTNRGTTVVTHQ